MVLPWLAHMLACAMSIVICRSSAELSAYIAMVCIILDKVLPYFENLHLENLHRVI